MAICLHRNDYTKSLNLEMLTSQAFEHLVGVKLDINAKALAFSPCSSDD